MKICYSNLNVSSLGAQVLILLNHYVPALRLAKNSYSSFIHIFEDNVPNNDYFNIDTSYAFDKSHHEGQLDEKCGYIGF